MDGSNGQVAEEYHPQRTPSPSGPPSPVAKQLPCGVNRTLLPIKGFYFVFMAGKFAKNLNGQVKVFRTFFEAVMEGDSGAIKGSSDFWF